ncbi:YgiQ family radical SAM protein [Azospirillum humicireducens]|uniref:YgiQ family radical SAM protein n=1 Tax=Azospirillum humicireducens TaxID=1226968 RepID=A0A160JI05_9PROT|nr:YgiQ family radical SAM protein [Azospirillum humicireducens]ANC92738.1 YgiQ family radical SAM protein [Azospirillum humicireducens]
MLAAPNLFAHRPDRSVRPKAAPFLPMSRAEMERLGWDQCDVIVVTGDAYVDHPSFGMAIIGRLLESQGLRVGIIAQPDWSSAEPFKILGKPRLFWGVTGGNMDSMVNHYTADRRLRHNDSYTPNDEGGKRPDRAVIVYSQRCREAFKDVPIVLGGIEASLRRIAQYDHWSEKIRRSVLVDSKADMLVYGNAERAIIEIAQRALNGESPKAMTDIRGTAIMRSSLPEGWTVVDSSSIDDPSAPVSPRAAGADRMVVRLPSYEQVTADKVLYAHASRVLHQESNPGNARALVQRHGDRDVWLNPPPIPLETNEMDGVYDLPYARAPHPSYGDARIPAWEMIRFSVNIMRGCFGGCSFCSITEHEGRIIQSRSEGSILREIELIRDKTKGFTGVISDMGGPTANMYRLACKDKETESVCRRPSCVFPDICKNLNTDHSSLVQLYRKARAVPGVKKIHIASGLRYDLAVRNPEYVKELVTHHVGGYLKIAPEHTEPGPLAKMMKPGMGAYDEFKRMFDKAAKEAGKKLYLIPYFIAAHPGTTDEDMMNLALWLKRNGFKADQVQTFLPSPMSLATAMYHSERNPLRPVRRVGSELVSSAKGLKQRRLHKAFLRYHDPENWPILREALKRLGREDLIGPGEEQLIPAWQPVGATAKPREKGPKGKTFLTQQAGQGRRVVPPVGKPSGAKPSGGNPSAPKPSGMKPRQTNLKGR